MSALYIQVPFPVFCDRDGAPLNNGSVYIGTANLNPVTNPILTYWDEALTLPAAQPLMTSGGYVMYQGTPSRVYVNADDFSITVKDNAGNLVYNAPEVMGAAGLRDDLALPSGSSLVGYEGGGTDPVALTVQTKLRQYVHVADYGAVGDNSTDDYDAILNAANEAAVQGTQLVFDGTKTYKIDQDTLTFPAGLNVRFNGAILNFTKTQGTNPYPAVEITGPFNADFLRVNIPTGVVRNYGVIAEGNNVSVQRITLTSVDQQAQLAAATDYGIKFANGARFLADKLVVSNFDRAIVTDTTTDSHIGGVDVTSYVRGYYSTGDVNIFVGASRIKVASPNASNTAGHNGVLLGTVGGTNNTFEDFTVEDAGEEGIRIAGGPQVNVHLVRPRVKNATANGIKVLGTSNAAPVSSAYQQNLFITDAIVEDCGHAGGSEDCNGILIQRSVGVQVSNPIIRSSGDEIAVANLIDGRKYIITKVGTTDFTALGAASNTVGISFTASVNPPTPSGTGEVIPCSAVYGILVYASNDVLITNPLIEYARFSGIYMLTEINANYSDLSRVNVIGGYVTNCGSDGVQIAATGKSTTAGSFIVGQIYTISSVGTTDFTLIGAASNTVGVSFTATGVGTGTGTANQNFIVRQVNITGIRLTDNRRRNVTLSDGTGGSFKSCFFSGYLYDSTGSTTTASMVCNSTAWLLDCYGKEADGSSPIAFASITSANSSRWSNETSFYVRKAGTWTAL